MLDETPHSASSDSVTLFNTSLRNGEITAEVIQVDHASREVAAAAVYRNRCQTAFSSINIPPDVVISAAMLSRFAGSETRETKENSDDDDDNLPGLVDSFEATIRASSSAAKSYNRDRDGKEFIGVHPIAPETEEKKTTQCISLPIRTREKRRKTRRRRTRWTTRWIVFSPQLS